MYTPALVAPNQEIHSVGNKAYLNMLISHPRCSHRHFTVAVLCGSRYINSPCIRFNLAGLRCGNRYINSPCTAGIISRCTHGIIQ